MPSKSTPSTRLHVATASASAQSTCPLCKVRHYINACSAFVSKNPSQRREIVKQYNRCFNCLSHSHSALECCSKYSCRICHKKHHTMLHQDSDSCSSLSGVTPSILPASQAVESKQNIQSLLMSTSLSTRSQVLLATAWVTVSVSFGRTATIR